MTSGSPASAEPAPTVPASRTGLDKSLAHSLAWRAAADWSSQIVTWAVFLVVARLLAPSDFGIVGMAVILFSYLKLVGQFGLPVTIATLRDLTEEQVAQLNGFAAMLGTICFSVACGLAYPLALFFKTPRVFAVMVVACSSLLALGFAAVPEGLLAKELRFRRLAVGQSACDIVSAAVTLAMAWRGFAYWALVVGNLCSQWAWVTLLVICQPCRFAWPRLASIRKALLVCGHNLVSSLAFASYERLDNVTAGRVLGASALGFYAMAWNLATVPLEKLTALVTYILPTYLATVQLDAAALRRYLRGLSEVMAIAVFPASIGLALVARDFVPLLLGRRWIPMVPVLEVLCPYVAFRSLVALLDKVLIAVGKTRFVMWTQLWALFILPCGFYIGSHWGIRGIAWGWVVFYPSVAVPLYWKTFRTIGLSLGDYFGVLRPAFDGAVIMVLGVVALKHYLPAAAPVMLRLALEILTGALLYAGTVLAVHRSRALAFWNLAKEFRRKRRGA